MTISRRDFLKIGGASCIVAGAGAALAGCSPAGGEAEAPLAETGEAASGEDIYLSAEVKEAEKVQEYYDFGEEYETPLSYAGEQMDELLNQWLLSMQNGLAKQLDYELMDRESGQTFSNTELALHYLGT